MVHSLAVFCHGAVTSRSLCAPDPSKFCWTLLGSGGGDRQDETHIVRRNLTFHCARRRRDRLSHVVPCASIATALSGTINQTGCTVLAAVATAHGSAANRLGHIVLTHRRHRAQRRDQSDGLHRPDRRCHCARRRCDRLGHVVLTAIVAALSGAINHTTFTAPS